jgi:predicted enzyme related to lactoylglutathione lyase
MQQGDFTHFEIPADDPGRAKAFYSGLFGWSFSDPIPGFDDYCLFTTPVGQEGMGGAIGKRGQSAPEKLRTYVHVDSVEASLQKVAELGGSVVTPKEEVPGQGWYGVFSDPEGNEIAVWESLPRG